jgi:hypothetical protein
MPAASITINGVTGSNTDLPINTLVNLNNNNVGDESSWAWTIEDKPTGSTASLTGATTTNPTFTPDVEGTYLIKLVVDAGLAGEATDKVVAAVAQLKSGLRIPAATETTEANSTRGWAETTNSLLRHHDDVEYSQIVYTGSAAGALTLGQLVYPSGVTTIKSGLPGEEDIPTLDTAVATAPLIAQEAAVGYVLRRADNGVGAIGANDLVVVMRRGIIVGLVGSPTVGDLVYLSDTGSISLTPGTLTRGIGVVISVAGGRYSIDFLGDEVPLISAPPDAKYLTDGADSVLTDERNIQALTVNLEFKTSDATTTPVSVENSNAAPTQPIFKVSRNAVMTMQVDADGDINIDGDIDLSGRSNTFDAGAGIGQSWLKTNTGDLTIGTADASDLIFTAAGVDSWKINNSTKELDSVGGPRKITGVATPVAGTDAVNKDYVDANAAPAVLNYGVERGVGTGGTTWYMTPGYEGGAAGSSPLAIIMPYAARITRLYITAGGAPNDDVVFTVQVQGVDSSLTATVASGTTDASDLVNAATCTTGQIITVKAVNGGSLNSAITNGVFVSMQAIKT